MAAALQAQHRELLTAFSGASPDLQRCRTLLTQLKIALIEAGLLIPDGAPADKQRAEQMALAREVLEIGAFWSIRVKDVLSFDRYMSQLRAYYNDYGTVLPPSSNHFPLLGLSLLRLLSSNQIGAFHTTLETLSAELVRDNPFLAHPVSLERWLMEGSYSKVWRARREVPREEYAFFVDSLMGTIRHEIASCEEKAYDSLPLSDAATLLFFENIQDVLSFANERGWQVNPTTQTVLFANKAAGQLGRDDIPKKATITSNLQFAKELESIV